MSKKSRQDLLVRVRYENPLPPPPFPPKLFNIPTDIYRLGEPSYLTQLAASTPLPMLVDSEMGMPIDLNEFEGVWDGDDQALNPVLDPELKLDLEDMALLPPVHRATAANGESSTAPDVTWMRTSNVFTRKAARRKSFTKIEEKHGVDDSEGAQLLAIDRSFEAQKETLRHPDANKRHLTAVETYELLPDDHAWSSQYGLFRFPERPKASEKILETSILRPTDAEGQSVQLYTTREDGLDALKSSSNAPTAIATADAVAEMEEGPERAQYIEENILYAPYDYIRSYEVADQPQLSKEFLLAIQEGKGAFYHKLNFRAILRKSRAKKDGDEEVAPYSKTRLTYRAPREGELDQRSALAAQFVDTDWVSGQMRAMHGENAAEGQGEAIDDEEDPMDEVADDLERD